MPVWNAGELSLVFIVRWLPVAGYEFGKVDLEGGDRLIMIFVDPHTRWLLVPNYDIRVVPRDSLD